MRILVFLLPGLGDALVAGPIFDGIAKAGARADVLTMLAPVAEYARALPMVDDVMNFNLHGGRWNALLAAARMRRRRYDLALLPFPSARWEYHALAAVVGARRSLTHRYGGLADAFDRSIGATTVELSGGHRSAENARLARAAGFEGSLRYVIPASWTSMRLPGLLGVHTGTMRYKGNESRRWPTERFVELIDANVAAGRRVRVFIGPFEDDDERALFRFRSSPRVEFVRDELSAAARSLSECEVFVANDAGFAHLAAGLGVKSVVLFGMTDPVRAQPLGTSLAVRPSDCPPCHDEGMDTFGCVRRIGFRCSRKDLTLADVARAVERAFAGPLAEHEPALSGSFRLYGRERDAIAQAATTAADATSHSNAANSDIASGR